MPELLAAPLVEAATAEAATATAAEIAAEQAAAEAAAQAAAEQAAAEAAAQAAAEQAAQQAAAQAAAEQAAQQAAQQTTQQLSTNGIQTLAQEVGVNANPTGIEQVFQQAQANNVPMSQAEFLNNSFAGPATPVSTPLTPSPTPPVTSQLPPFSGEQYLNTTMPGSVSAAPPATPSVAPVVEAPAAAQQPIGNYEFSSGLRQGVNAPLDTASRNTYALGNQTGNYNLAQSVPSPAATATANPEPSGLEGLLNKGIEYAKNNPLSSLSMANTAYNLLNKPAPYEPKKYKSTWNAGAYSGYEPVQPTPYKPNYAQGGLAEHYAMGGQPAASSGNVGMRGGAAQNRVGMSGTRGMPANKPPAAPVRPSFNPMQYTAGNVARPIPYRPQYAHGGLADLGGYSDGGRMLKGPGDGMSDDIPATIANKQPARLANEEFVIPADVVSHLGNGSSEAGAKQLYKMMDRVRKARTGTKKQGKQINPEKYLA